MTLSYRYHGTKLRNEPWIYRSRYLAETCIRECSKPMRLMSGMPGQFLIVCPSDAARLEKAGFEYAQTTSNEWS